MTLVVFFAFLTLFLIGTNGKPSFSCAPDVIGPKIGKCIYTLKDMSEMTKNAKDMNEKQKTEYLDDCEFFLSCRPEFECLNNSDIRVAFRAMEVQCKSAKFLIKDFAECDKKLDILNSKCSQNYNPFEGIDEKEMPSILKNGRKEKCDNLFGKDDCMRKEIIEVCGRAEFERFKKVQMEHALALRLCEFNKSS